MARSSIGSTSRDSDRSGICIFKDRYINPKTPATAVATDSVQQTMGIGYADGTIDLYNRESTIAGHLTSLNKNRIAHLAFIPSSPALVAIDDTGVLDVFDTDAMRHCFAYRVPSRVTSVSTLPGTSWIALGTELGRVYFVDCVRGRKSDFSVGCQTRPANAVANAQFHPSDANQLLIAYTDGTCVIWAIKSAEIISRFRFKHPIDAFPDLDTSKRSSLLMEINDARYAHAPKLVGAWWAPDGDAFAVSYDSGYLCMFDLNNPDPVVTWSAEDIVGRALGGRMYAVCNVRWCRRNGSLFIVATTGSAQGLQHMMHLINVGARRELTNAGRVEFRGSVAQVAAVGSAWANQSEDVGGFVVVTEFPPAISIVRASDDALRVVDDLPGEVAWRSAWAAPVAHVSIAASSSSLSRAARAITIGECLYGTPRVETTVETGDVLCCADDAGVVTLWGVGTMHIARCAHTWINTQNVGRLLGVQGRVSSVDVYSLSGLVIVGFDSGESLVCIATVSTDLTLARRVSSIREIREAALTYYYEAAVDDDSDSSFELSDNDNDNDDDGSKPAALPARHRTISWIEGRKHTKPVTRRGPGPLGTMIRRSGRLDPITEESNESTKDRLLRTEQADPVEPTTHRLEPADNDAWKTRSASVNAALSDMLYGIELDASDREKVGGQALSAECDSPAILPFLLARFYRAEAISVVAGCDGLAAVVFGRGAFTVIDCLEQRVLLADNINLKLDSAQTAKDVLRGDRTAHSHADITAFNIIKAGPGALIPVDIESDAAELSDYYVVAGTSSGQISLYSVYGSSAPRTIQWSDSAVVFADVLGSGESATPIATIGEDPWPLIVATRTSVTVHSGFTREPQFSYTIPDGSIAVRAAIVALESGACCIVVVDSSASVRVLALPALQLVACERFAELENEPADELRVVVSPNGRVAFVGAGSSLLLQVSVRDMVGGWELPAPKFFDSDKVYPDPPAKRGFASWIFGGDVGEADAFLSRRFRDLVVGGGCVPGLQSRESRETDPISSGYDVLGAHGNETKDALERRGERLGEIEQKVNAMAIQSAGFLADARALNKKKKEKKFFGLF